MIISVRLAQPSLLSYYFVSVNFNSVKNLHLSCLQIYVEIERARLTRTLAKIREDAGKVAEAADILQELQVINTPVNIRLIVQ